MPYAGCPRVVKKVITSSVSFLTSNVSIGSPMTGAPKVETSHAGNTIKTIASATTISLMRRSQAGVAGVPRVLQSLALRQAKRQVQKPEVTGGPLYWYACSEVFTASTVIDSVRAQRKTSPRLLVSYGERVGSV